MSLWIILKLAPKNFLSRLMGRFTRLRFPTFVRLQLLSRFAARYKLNMIEAEKPLLEYATIQELFTRTLKSSVRPLGSGAVVHPADASLTARGVIQSGQLIQAKGISYTVADLVLDSNWAGHFEGGSFLTYYLCPTDYHRVHSPVDGELLRIHGVSGELWPVNEWSVSRVPRLFAINERVNFFIETEQGRVFLSMVGATNVGEVSTPLWPGFSSNRGASQVKEFTPAQALSRGQEIGTFHLGSTVILLFDKQFKFSISPGLPIITKVKSDLRI